MLCPWSSSQDGLKTHYSKTGEDYVPVILEGYYSTADRPLEVYKCRNHIQCPGGKPGTCGGPAACSIGLFVFLTMAYYLLTSQVTAKASVMATTGMSFGMTVNLLQSVGIVGMMTVEWPPHLTGILAAFQAKGDKYHGAILAGGLQYHEHRIDGDRRHMVQSFRFLVFRFRLELGRVGPVGRDSWWYGVPLLVRGPLLSLPIALATDYPPVQSIMVNVILSMFLIIETLSWPWKVPLLNIMDMWMTLCLMLLVTGSTLYVDVSDGSMAAFASAFTTAVMGGIGLAMAVMFVVAVCALMHRAAMGGAQEFAFFNLGKVPESTLVRERLQKISMEILRLDEDWLKGRISSMSAFEAWQTNRGWTGGS
eukprot:Skav206306  [mRNA]  locus=scaffold4747:47143:53846:+ [translate_table: standard]